MVFFILSIIALCILPWIFFIILFDRTGKLAYRVDVLEKKIKELSSQPNAAAPAQLPVQQAPLSQTAAEQTPQQPEQTTQAPAAAAPVMAASAKETPHTPSTEQAQEQQVSPLQEVLQAQTVQEQPAPSAEAQLQVSSAPQTENSLPAHIFAAQAAQNASATQAQTNQQNKKSQTDWSNFTSAKLLSWIGGFTLFLGFAFWIKYSIENNLISPAMRIAIAAGIGLVLVGLGAFIKKDNFKTTANTLCGVGVSVLYASVFGAYAFYHLIGSVWAFVLMALIAFSAFGLAVWKDSKYIGFLAEIICFLTPFLFPNTRGFHIFFFTYVACINIAAGASALAKKWNSLLIGSVTFTFLCQIIALFVFTENQTFSFCLFSLIYALAAAFAARKYTAQFSAAARNALGLFIAANMFFVPLALGGVAETNYQAMQFLGLGLCLNLLLVYLTCSDRKMHTLAWRIGKGAIFLALLIWNSQFAQNSQLLLTLVGFLTFAAINGGTDLFLYKKQERQPGFFAILFPVFLMLPIAFDLVTSTAEGFLVFVAILTVLMLISVLLAALAGSTRAILTAGFVFVAALLGCTVAENLPATYWSLLFVFALFPTAATFAAGHWVKPGLFTQNAAAVFISALMPYILLITASGIGGKALYLFLLFTLLLNLLCLFFAYVYKNGKLIPAALVGSTLVQLICFFEAEPYFGVPFILWTLGLGSAFAAFPFVFKKRFFEDKAAWASASLSGAVSFVLVAMAFAHFMDYKSAIVALFFAVIYGALSYTVAYWQPIAEGIQRTRMAWLGGVTLLFVTAAFPLQFQGPWLTICWALEGAALVWLNRKLMHPGLTRTGFFLLGFVFLRVLFATDYTLPESTTFSLFNNFFYLFGISGAAMLTAAALWKPEEEEGFAGTLRALGGFLLFALMNLEIATYFSLESGTLSFDIFGAFDAAIAYTIGWTVFGSICMFLGYGSKKSYASSVGLLLIGLALLKLFLSDIWALGGLYRIFGLFGVAIVLIGVSFVFQALRKK